ncbi:MAG: hypothetical protein HC929_13465 [Leptolyngbyaceae cyanobacterium SM2_5_2]|nr:hypothetical protein [Leptolyngbyaceae cyanobacterium SM2_5_2]
MLIPLLAQATPPTPSPTDVIDLLKESNQALSNSFSQFIDAMRFVLVILGILGAFVTFIFGKSLNDARQIAKEAITQEVNRRIREIVDDEVGRVQRLLEPERIVSTMTIDYVVPRYGGEEPEEARALRVRGFRTVNPYYQFPTQRLLGNIIVLDMVNSPVLDIPNTPTLNETARKTQQDTRLEEQIDQIIQVINDDAVLVIYVRDQFPSVTRLFRQRKRSASANFAVRLITTVVDSAYLAYGLQRQ